MCRFTHLNCNKEGRNEGWSSLWWHPRYGILFLQGLPDANLGFVAVPGQALAAFSGFYELFCARLIIKVGRRSALLRGEVLFMASSAPCFTNQIVVLN